jgi:hypothetical protein
MWWPSSRAMKKNVRESLGGNILEDDPENEEKGEAG